MGGAERVLFGSDYPVESLGEAVRFARSLKLSVEDIERIMSSTRKKCSGLPSDVSIVDAEVDRGKYEWILEEGFSGLYLWHARRTLHSAELVRVALVGGEPAGLVIPKRIGADIGYVYYIAVAKRFRGRGVGGALLDDVLAFSLRMVD